MTRETLIASAFLLSAAAVVGLGAGSTANLRGSNNLFNFTNAVLASCPGTVGPYLAGGNGSGQTAMLSGAQQVAPMSRFLDTAACTGAAAMPAQSEGLVVGLDSIVIVSSNQTGGSVACTGDANVSCNPTFEPNTGAAFDTVVAGYTFGGWPDVLRVLFAGFTHDIVGTGAAQWALRDCNSAVRLALANGYGNFFENNCTAPAGDATGGVCTQIRHVFRPGDFSETTETLVSLLNLPSVVYPETTVGGVAQHTGATPFCNAVRPAFAFPSPAPSCLQGSDSTWDPTSKNLGAGCTKENAVYRAPMQDNDPIRRTCFGSGTGALGTLAEDNCSHSGDLGLLLAMNDVAEPGDVGTTSDPSRYNAVPCAHGHFTSVTPPEVYDAVTQGRQICARGLLCPNGDVCTFLGACIAPADANANPQCLAHKLTSPPITTSSLAVPAINPRIPGIAEGRAYNQHLYKKVGPAGAYQTSATPTPMFMTGAFFRIHTIHSMNPAASPATSHTCQFPNMSDQIGCLVDASPCSIGYAAGVTLATNANAAAIKIKAQNPLALCVQRNFTYPLANKLYLNAVPGFAAVAGQELQLAGCMTDVAQAKIGTPAGLVTANIAAAGFVQIPPFVNSGEPYCEDFNEAAICGALVNIEACVNDKPNLGAFPAYDAVCGNGLIDAFEECDGGTLNGPPPAPCSTTCRLN